MNSLDFFHVAKVFWFATQPGDLLVLLLVAALVLERTRWRNASHGIVAAVTVVFVAVLLLPLDQWVARPLEDRFPHPPLPDCVDGIIVLGGGELPRISASRGDPAIHAAGRYAAATMLMRRFPDAKIVFSGGTGDVMQAGVPEAEAARAMLGELGQHPERVIYESDSRDTFENFEFSKRLVKPAPREVWVLVTSALHMPRSVGVARKLGWTVLPWATDYETPGPDERPALHWSLAASLTVLDAAVKEWIGLVVYDIKGRSSVLLPAPEPVPAGTCPTAR
jgi:uncharacterized SAM-binding protein YcdF (DUF218 family)